MMLAAVARPVFAQQLGQVDVTYRDRNGGISTASFGTEPNGSGPNIATGDIWASYLNNLSPETGNAIIVTPVVDPILDLITTMRNDTQTVWTEFYFTLPSAPGVGFFNYRDLLGNPLTTGGRFVDFEFLSPNGILPDDGTGNAQQLYSEIRFYNPNPGLTGIGPGENNTFRWFAVFPDPPVSGPVSYVTQVRPNNVITNIPEPGTLALALCMVLPAAGHLILRRRLRG
jgi:hypothetical protein